MSYKGDKLKKYFSIIIFGIFCLLIGMVGVDNNRNMSAAIPVSKDENGIEYYSPTKVAIYAIQYCGQDSCVEKEVEPNKKKAQECINWLIDNAVKDNDGCLVWENVTYDEYSGVTNSEKWISSYTQAVAIEAFWTYYVMTENEIYLQYAMDAAKVLMKNVNEGGLLLEENGEIWFETIEREKEQYDLIGHIRVLLALSKLVENINNSEYGDLYNRAADTLKHRFSFYDLDYCIKDNLRVKQSDIKFRFSNEYGDENNTEIIQNLTLRDPVTEETIEIEEIDKNGEFICSLPSVIEDCFRTEWLELLVEYEDSIDQHMTLQKESLVDEGEWVSVKDGDILLTGSGTVKKWIIPIRVEDLGFTVSENLASQYKEIFKALAATDNRFKSMEDRSTAYYNLNSNYKDYQILMPEKKELPTQTPMSVVASFDEEGVIRQHSEIEGSTTYDKNGSLADTAIVGKPSYSLYMISNQAIYGKDYWSSWYNLDISIFKDQEFWSSYDFLTKDNIDRIKSEPAYRWIEKNVKRERGIATWSYDTYNCYNDLEQEEGWISAYGQAVMVEALMKYPVEYKELIREACYAYDVSVEDGGYASRDYSGDIWFEEVPNKSHILNADILSINTLNSVCEIIEDDQIESIASEGEKSLKNNLWRYDTGYWSKYDMNPNKEILFQIDWVSGESSPLIDEIMLCDPVSECANVIDVGEDNDFGSYPHISGVEWGETQVIDGVTVRSLRNGYLENHEITNGSTDQNSYFLVVIPELVQDDYFDLMPYKLIIRYKDVAEGRFEIKRQSISEGNYLEFEQLPNASIECTGDGQWKEAEIIIRPQDLGWYMGAEYQEFHVEQLKQLADTTGDWFYEQYAEKWEYYLSRG